MSQSFSLKTIQITITLGKGKFSSGGNVKVIEGLACDVSVIKPGGLEKNSANVRIWGLNYNTMAELTMLSFMPLESNHNLITIEAADQGKPFAMVFHGEIISAFADFNQAPSPVMQLEADSGGYAQQIPMPVQTVRGTVEADQLFSQFATAAGYTYRNEGVTTTVSNAWYPGSPIDKMNKLAKDIGCDLIIDDGMIIVMPAGKPRAGNAVLLSKDTGMIGYPTFNQNGITCRCIFNPNLSYGGLVKVESIVPRAEGIWRIVKLTHAISAYIPNGGNWESLIEAVFN